MCWHLPILSCFQKYFRMNLWINHELRSSSIVKLQTLGPLLDVTVPGCVPPSATCVRMRTCPGGAGGRRAATSRRLRTACGLPLTRKGRLRVTEVSSGVSATQGATSLQHREDRRHTRVVPKLHAWPRNEDISGCFCAERPRRRRQEHAGGSWRDVSGFARWQLAEPAQLRVCARDRISYESRWPLELRESCTLRFYCIWSQGTLAFV